MGSFSFWCNIRRRGSSLFFYQQPNSSDEQPKSSDISSRDSVFVDSPKPDRQLRSDTFGMHTFFVIAANLSPLPSKRDSSMEKALNMDADLDPRRWNLLLREFVDWMEASSPHTKRWLASPVYNDDGDRNADADADADDEAYDGEDGQVLLRSSDKRRLNLEDSLLDIEGPLCAEERLIGENGLLRTDLFPYKFGSLDILERIVLLLFTIEMLGWSAVCCLLSSELIGANSAVSGNCEMRPLWTSETDEVTVVGVVKWPIRNR